MTIMDHVMTLLPNKMVAQSSGPARPPSTLIANHGRTTSKESLWEQRAWQLLFSQQSLSKEDQKNGARPCHHSRGADFKGMANIRIITSWRLPSRFQEKAWEIGIAGTESLNTDLEMVMHKAVRVGA
jgi:hypothetical protein